jgi:AbrB family looped-hinge helix DNA binding protein
MAATTKMTRNYQVTVPKSVREQLGLSQGDIFSVEAQGSDLVLKRQRLVDADQAWFWTDEWQKGEREADEDIAAGRVWGPYKTADELMDEVEAYAASLASSEE